MAPTCHMRSGDGANPGHARRKPDPARRNCSPSCRRSITGGRRRQRAITGRAGQGGRPTWSPGRSRPASTSSTTARWASPPGSPTSTSGPAALSPGRWRANFSTHPAAPAGTGSTSPARTPSSTWSSTTPRSGSGRRRRGPGRPGAVDGGRRRAACRRGCAPAR